MKKLSLYVFLVLMWCNVSAAQSMVPLKKYVIDNSQYVEDPITLTYVLKRCGAAYLYAATITKDKDKKISEQFTKAYRKVTMFAGQVLMEGMNWSEEVASKSLFTDIENMLNYYEIDGNDSFARTGNYMMDNYIAEDIIICNGVLESMK